MKVSPLVGFKSYRAMLAFHTLMLGLKMIPEYMSLSYEEFFETIEKMSEADQKKVIVSASKHVPLDEPEMLALLCFCKDDNGVPFTAENIGDMSPDKLMEVIVTVCCEIAKIRVDFASESEKKN